MLKKIKADEENSTLIGKLKYLFLSRSIKLDDPRIKDIIEYLDELETTNQDIDFDIFKEFIKPRYNLLRSLIKNRVTVTDWESFVKKTQEIFDKINGVDFGGFIPEYIPQLKKVDESAFSVSICTVDGQIFNFGDTTTHVSLQAISSVISYLTALEQHGQDTVSKFIGTEPSGKSFNSLELMNGIPHNPLINSGNLTSCYLLYQDESIDRKYELYSKVVQRLIGDRKVHFNNEMYLSEIAHADRNYCLLYMLKEAKTFPQDTDVKKILQFYTQTWAIEISVESYAILAASLANGGICPLTEDRVFEDSNAVKGVLSQMLSCGMNTYSGKWAFKAGLPAKSSVAGMMILVIPNTMGIAVWSPKLDRHHISKKGQIFLSNFVKKFKYDNIDQVYGANIIHKLAKKVESSKDDESASFNLLYYAKQNNLREIRKSIANGRDINYADYDSRTALHLAANYGNFEIVKYLVSHGARVGVKDRFNNTPIDEAENNGYPEIVEYLKEALEEQS